MNGYQFYWSIVWDSLPLLFAGAWVTIQITILAFIIGTLIAMPMAVARQQGEGWAYRFSTWWVELARNTPAVFQLYLFYFGLGAFHINIPSYAAVLISVSFQQRRIYDGNIQGWLSRHPATATAGCAFTRHDQLAKLHPCDLPADVQGDLPCLCHARHLGNVEYLPLACWSDCKSSREPRSTRNRHPSGHSSSFLVTALIYYLIAKGLQLSSHLAFRLIYRS